ncbi:MAG: hypothetical protein NC084_03315 [Bacteroides sp.]|nr:hypothetical protein [Eubacterium sp.]MCM1417563.1 hypothetical protein [Roseburia sp.]MCM1461726.1 hypothetical protein [Bacteroides sp.]
MRNFLWRLGFILTLLGVMFTFMTRRDVIDNMKTPLNYNLMSASDVKEGAVVEGNLFVNYGSYEEQYTTGTFGNKTGSSSYWYLIPVGDEEFMGIYTGNSDLIATLNRQTDETYALLNEETDADPTVVHFKGKIVKMDSEDETYFRNGMLELGFTPEEIEQYGIKSYIKIIFFDNMWIPFAIGIVALLAGIAILIIMFIRKRQGL